MTLGRPSLAACKFFYQQQSSCWLVELLLIAKLLLASKSFAIRKTFAGSKSFAASTTFAGQQRFCCQQNQPIPAKPQTRSTFADLQGYSWFYIWPAGHLLLATPAISEKTPESQLSPEARRCERGRSCGFIVLCYSAKGQPFILKLHEHQSTPQLM